MVQVCLVTVTFVSLCSNTKGNASPVYFLVVDFYEVSNHLQMCWDLNRVILPTQLTWHVYISCIASVFGKEVWVRIELNTGWHNKNLIRFPSLNGNNTWRDFYPLPMCFPHCLVISIHGAFIKKWNVWVIHVCLIVGDKSPVNSSMNR